MEVIRILVRFILIIRIGLALFMGYDASHTPFYLNLSTIYHEEGRRIMISTEEKNKLMTNFSLIFDDDINSIVVEDLQILNKDFDKNNTNTSTTNTVENKVIKNSARSNNMSWPRLKETIDGFDNMIKTNREKVNNMRMIDTNTFGRAPIKEEKKTETTKFDDLGEMKENYDNYEEELAKRLEIEMENKRKAEVTKTVESTATTRFGSYGGDCINNQKCAVYTLRCNGHCSICDRKCNGYISSESIVETKVVDVAALCLMERKSPKVMYVSKTDIENLLSGKMSIVTPDGTAIVFNGRK